MLDPTALYQMASHVDPRTVRAKAMVVTLGSYVDAGHVQRQIDDHLIDTLPNHVLARFDADQVLDYRGNRPLITFDRDRFTDYEKPEITLRHVTDANGVAFLLLSGPEPAFQWERMAKAVGHLGDTFGVGVTATVQGIPMAAPHTRPVALTRSASNPDLVPGNQPLFGTVRMGASFPAMLSLRLAESGHNVLGLAAHIPHYLTETIYPDGAIALIDALARHTDLNLPTESLEPKARQVRGQIDQQVAASEEVTGLVAALEERYDAVVAQIGTADEVSDLPSADELGAEAEEFLRGLG